MTIYDTRRVRELANEQLRKDVLGYTYQGKPKYEGEKEVEEYEMTDEQFKRYWCVYQISKHTYAKGIFADWKFYFQDDAWDLIQELFDRIPEYCDFDVEEFLEEAKSEKLIDGFFDLGDDLWIINNRNDEDDI